MIVLKFKVRAKTDYYQEIYKAILTAQFVQNKYLRYWMDNQGVGRYDLNKYCRVLAHELSFT